MGIRGAGFAVENRPVVIRAKKAGAMKEKWIDTQRNLWYLMIDNVVVKGVIAQTLSPVR